MTYLSGRRNKKKQLLTYSMYVAIFFIVIFFWTPIKGLLYPMVEPILIKYGATKSGVNSYISTAPIIGGGTKDLLAQNEALTRTIERLQNELAKNNNQNSNIEFSTLNIGTTTDSSPSLLYVYPLMQDVTKMYSTILLSSGFKSGISAGSYVFVSGREAVCVIKEVYVSTSLCLLLSASGVLTEAVSVGASSTINLSLYGRGGGYIADVARDTPISVGDIVYLKSDPSVTIGKVISLYNNNQDTAWHVFVEGGYNPVTTSRLYLEP